MPETQPTAAAAAQTPVAPKAPEVNTATLIMGPTTTGKSSLGATHVEYVWEEFGLQTLVYLFDGGGFPSRMQALINHGIARLWRVRSRSGPDLAPETVHRASQGYFPERIDPRTGDCAPTASLVRPVMEVFTVYCPEGHATQTVSVASAIPPSQQCKTCAKLVTHQNMKVTSTAQVAKGFEKVGARFYDSLTAACSMLLDDLSRREMGGERDSMGGRVQSGAMSFGGNNRAQIGFAQSRAENWILNSSAIPGMVVPAVWTALTKEGDDENLTIKGPDLAGKARTASAPQWFGNTFETMVVEKEGRQYRRLQLAAFVDGTGVRHLCKTRAEPGYMPEYLEDEVGVDANGQPLPSFVNFNLGTVWKMLANARQRIEQQMAAKYADLPGLPEGEVTYGEPEVVAAMPSAPTGHAPALGPKAHVGPTRGPVVGPKVNGPKAAPPPAVVAAQAAEAAQTGTPPVSAAAAPIVAQIPTPLGPKKAGVPPPPGAPPPPSQPSLEGK